MRKFSECPKCFDQGLLSKSYYRLSAFDLEHEMRCPECSYKWDPSELWDQEQHDRSELNTHRD